MHKPFARFVALGALLGTALVGVPNASHAAAAPVSFPVLVTTDGPVPAEVTAVKVELTCSFTEGVKTAFVTVPPPYSSSSAVFSATVAVDFGAVTFNGVTACSGAVAVTVGTGGQSPLLTVAKGGTIAAGPPPSQSGGSTISTGVALTATIPSAVTAAPFLTGVNLHYDGPGSPNDPSKLRVVTATQPGSTAPAGTTTPTAVYVQANCSGVSGPSATVIRDTTLAIVGGIDFGFPAFNGDQTSCRLQAIYRGPYTAPTWISVFGGPGGALIAGPTAGTQITTAFVQPLTEFRIVLSYTEPATTTSSSTTTTTTSTTTTTTTTTTIPTTTKATTTIASSSSSSSSSTSSSSTSSTSTSTTTTTKPIPISGASATATSIFTVPTTSATTVPAAPASGSTTTAPTTTKPAVAKVDDPNVYQIAIAKPSVASTVAAVAGAVAETPAPKVATVVAPSTKSKCKVGYVAVKVTTRVRGKRVTTTVCRKKK